MFVILPILKPWEEYDNIEEEVIQRIEREVKKLPSRSRDIIECVYLKGMRYKEQQSWILCGNGQYFIGKCLEKVKADYG